MSASLSGIVNQHLFHAKLLLEMADSLAEEQATADKTAAFAPVKIAALENSSVSATFHAYQAFLIEVANSCQIKSAICTVEQLADLLAAEGRSHAVVANLIELSHRESWLSALTGQYHDLLTKSPQAKTAVNSSMIALSDSTPAMDIGQIIEQFQTFITGQRAYLQEW
jgi:hypothetical protein